MSLSSMLKPRAQNIILFLPASVQIFRIAVLLAMSLAQTAIAQSLPGLAPPAGLTAVSAGPTQISLAWQASPDTSVTHYILWRQWNPNGYVGQLNSINIAAPTADFTDSGLEPDTTYRYAIQACAGPACSDKSHPLFITDSAVQGSDSQPPSAQTQAGPISRQAYLLPGWNLVGNAFWTPINVSAFFGTPDAPVVGISDKVISVWKWLPGSNQWAFYAPGLSTAEVQDYANQRGYTQLLGIGPGEAYWVKTTQAVMLPLQTGLSYTLNASRFSSLPSGWSMLSIRQQEPAHPRALNLHVSPTPPAPDEVPQNFRSLWVWSNILNKWYFYSPAIDASGGRGALKSYADSHGHLDFDSTYPRICQADVCTADALLPPRLEWGIGFWLYKE